jgi:spermidine/putrescine transport system permease protein
VIEAARSLGGSGLAVFRTVTFPMTMTGAKAAFAFAFVLTCGDYVTPTLVGGTNGIMIGNVIADQFGVSYNWPLGAALAITTMVAVLVVFAVVSRLMTVVAR